MADSKDYQDWYYKAAIDLKSAKTLFHAEAEEDNIDYSISSFNCQQCIEKYLKGFILKNTDNLLTGHDLSFLCKKASNIDVFFRKFRDDCKFVDNFYVETRYPASFIIVKKHEAEDCLKIAAKIADFVLSYEKVLTSKLKGKLTKQDIEDMENAQNQAE
ncbi:MAG: HEPN domain-containing protein [Oscillospiraceae bacterium]|nr:HEPN domain-containing protein [Oscillospiraceae bacterium]